MYGILTFGPDLETSGPIILEKRNRTALKADEIEIATLLKHERVTVLCGKVLK